MTSKELFLLKNKIGELKPIVFHITNYVSVNDCANITLASNASPIMSDYYEDVEDIIKIANSLVINIGTLNAQSVKSMFLAAKKANERNIPIILDPVGAGASNYRNETLKQLLNEAKFSIIKGNVSEIKFLVGLESSTKGVDASSSDELEVTDLIALAKKCASFYDCIVVITGVVDVIADSKVAYLVRNGHPNMSKITGTGCMLASILGSYSAITTDYLKAALAATLTISIAGEIAAANNGNNYATLRNELINSVATLDEATIEKKANYEKR